MVKLKQKDVDEAIEQLTEFWSSYKFALTDHDPHHQEHFHVMTLAWANKLVDTLTNNCDHMIHSNPGLIMDCPACGATADERMKFG